VSDSWNGSARALDALADKLPKVAEQVEALAEVVDPRYRTLIRFAAYSGLGPQ
jgi:hypothetical protein